MARILSQKLARADRAVSEKRRILATLTAYTATSIADAYRRWLPRLPEEMILGGGRASTTQPLLRMIADELPPCAYAPTRVWRSDDAKEGAGICPHSGMGALLGVPANVPGGNWRATGHPGPGRFSVTNPKTVTVSVSRVCVVWRTLPFSTRLAPGKCLKMRALHVRISSLPPGGSMRSSACGARPAGKITRP